ncbi:MAG: penicillin acylase family protein, partial [Actinobacteria bacterium]|nr:penicillin acylase family protein [Actinomycetota bacterium]
MRWLKRIGVLLIVVVLGAAAYGTYLVRSSFPRVAGEVMVPGLEDRVEVIRDEWGVPHIYAATAHDLFLAQGYVHAQDRFWQMDFWRHIGAGRLSEMFGADLVDSDVFLRSLDFTGLATRELEMMDPEVRGYLESYAQGVNAYLAERTGASLGFEYFLLGLQNRDYVVEPWTPIHTLTWAKLMSWDLSGNMADEIERAVLAKAIPIERVEQLYPPFPADHPVIVEGGAGEAGDGVVVEIPDAAIEALGVASRAAEGLWAVTGGGFEGIGSNNWVVSGALTESGMPLLANDTHLAIQMPAIWYSNGLHCVGEGGLCPWGAVGFSFPGAPGVVIGHNGRIAWGVTTEAVDTQDLYIERVNPDDSGQYEVEGEWVDFERRRETIVVAGGDDLTFEVLSTRHGPVISDTFLEEGELDGSAGFDEPDEYVVALAWQTLHPSTLVEAIFGIGRATDYEEFRAAASLWDIAAQNIVYADV